MNHAPRCQTGQFFSRHTFHGFGTPICTHITEHLPATGQQVAEQHGHCVAGVVFSSQHVCLADTVPVERAAHQSFREIPIGLPVRPLTLSLETCSNGIMPDGLFLEAHLTKPGITLHQITDDKGHFHDKFPISIFLFPGFLPFGTVFIPTFFRLAILLRPCHSFIIFFVVIYSLFHATQDFGLVHTFIAHAQIFLKEILVHDTACNTHALAADGQIALPAHLGHSHGCTRPTQYLFGHVGRNGIVIQILHVMPIDAESGQSFLSVPGQYGSQIYGSRTLGPVKAPYGFRPIRIHVHRLRAITPTGSYGNRSPYPLALEFPGTGRTLAYAPYCAVGNHAFHRRTVAILHVRRNQICDSPSQTHGLVFQTFADTALPTVDGRTNTNLRILVHNIKGSF